MRPGTSLVSLIYRTGRTSPEAVTVDFNSGRTSTFTVVTSGSSLRVATTLMTITSTSTTRADTPIIIFFFLLRAISVSIPYLNSPGLSASQRLDSKALRIVHGLSWFYEEFWRLVSKKSRAGRPDCKRSVDYLPNLALRQTGGIAELPIELRQHKAIGAPCGFALRYFVWIVST